MGIREAMNDNPKLAVRATSVLLVVCIIFMLYYLWPRSKAVSLSQEFFSDDDGAHWFADDAAKLAPFDHNGKEAVIAKVFRSSKGTRFVGYLEKFSDEAKQRITEGRKTKRMPLRPGEMEGGVMPPDLFVKKPHDEKWVPAGTADARAVQTITPPDGSSDYEPFVP